MKGVIIIEEKRKVDFHSTQLYINKKEDVDALNEDFESLGLTNKSDYLRGLIMLGLETKKNQERNVSIKEKESLVKLDELSNKINEVKELLSNVDFDNSVYELFEELKKSFDETFMTVIGTVNKVNKKINKNFIFRSFTRYADRSSDRMRRRQQLRQGFYRRRLPADGSRFSGSGHPRLCRCPQRPDDRSGPHRGDRHSGGR